MEQATLVRVTREHIARGVAGDCRRCPIALALIGALGDLLPEGSSVGVGLATAVIYLPSGEICARLPVAARNFIADFDDDDLDQPGPFGFALTWSGAEALS